MKFAVAALVALVACCNAVFAAPASNGGWLRAHVSRPNHATNASCAVSGSDKIDCGFSGIEKDGCVKKGCCWAEVSPNPDNEPWCFYSKGSNPCGPLGLASVAAAPFSPAETQTMLGFFMANINIDGKGGVVASPDHATPGGSYYYHWERDGALSMNALLQITPLLSPASALQTPMRAYVQWVLGRQAEQDPNGQDVRTEPKYQLPDGAVYTGGWCRPQTDGPGLRAVTLANYGQQQWAAGEQAYVKEFLWTGDSSKRQGGAIKHDLDWVAANWESQGCDLWEEIRSDDFFWNRMIFKNALLVGAAFAKLLGDAATATRYAAAAAAVNATLPAHFNGQFVMETQARQKDAAVIVAFNDGFSVSAADDGLFGPNSVAVAGTVQAYNELFCLTFPVNQADNQAGVPGIFYGRYAGDHYAGGNPWVLSTGALAQLFYRGALETLQRDALPEPAALAVWRTVFGLDTSPLTPKDFAGFQLRAGDGVLLRLRKHVAPNGFHLSEQIDKSSGAESSAADLTWSYGTVLKALNSRMQVVAHF